MENDSFYVFFTRVSVQAVMQDLRHFPFQYWAQIATVSTFCLAY